MKTAFRSALGKIKAEESLKKRTEDFLVGKAKETNHRVVSYQRKKHTKRLVAAVFALVLLCGFSFGGYAYYQTPTSYLDIDINPSVEIGINTFGKVVSATAINDDGKIILEGKNVIGMDVGKAVKTLVKSAADNGFINDDGSTIISITSVTDNEETAAKLEDAAEKGAKEAIESTGDTATIQKENVAIERRDEAKKLGITPGKLNLIQKLQALDPTITVEQYKDKTVTEIQKKFIELKKESKNQNQNGKDKDDTSPSPSEGTVTVSPSAPNTSPAAVSSDPSSSSSNNGKSGNSTNNGNNSSGNNSTGNNSDGNNSGGNNSDKENNGKSSEHAKGGGANKGGAN